MALPARFDTTLAFKAICLAPTLSGLDKRAAAAILDHFNHRTGQCDPSLDTIAELLGVHRRSVIRSVEKLVACLLFLKTRHGGNFHRNFYEPSWSQFRKLETAWSEHRRARSTRLREERESRLGRRKSQPSGDQAATQTCSRNPSNESYEPDSKFMQRPSVDASSSSGLGNGKKGARSSSRFKPRNVSSEEAQRSSAERHWNDDLTAGFAGEPEIYALIIGKLSLELQDLATSQELECRGAGMGFILEKLGPFNSRGEP